jgi:hypothetical protein
MSRAIISKLIETTLKQCLFLAQWNYICICQTTIISNPMEQKKSTTIICDPMEHKINHTIISSSLNGKQM